MGCWLRAESKIRVMTKRNSLVAVPDPATMPLVATTVLETALPTRTTLGILYESMHSRKIHIG